MKRVKTMLATAVIGSSLVAGSGYADAKVSDTSIVVQGYEFGPAVSKVVVTLSGEVSAVDKTSLEVKTADIERQVSKVYLSDKAGKETKSKSRYVTVQLPVSFDSQTNAGLASPFVYNLTSLHNEWVDTYKVSIKGLSVTAGGKKSELSVESDTIAKRQTPQTELFNNRGDFAGTYTNPLTNEEEELRLSYAAYEPKSLAKGDKNHLLIWLHGQGEGGTDTDITLLGNEVVSLASQPIQKYFTSGKQTGAYVLAIQTPTYWMDEGDGTNGAGAGVSRYTDILMDTIKDYVTKHPDVDTSRIYLAGCSNGGYMTLNLAIQNPDYFAALVPQAAAYSYYQYERNEDGTYVTVPSDTSLSGRAFVRTDQPYMNDSKLEALKDIPIWFVHAANDTIVDPTTYSLPIYKALLETGADNKWFSYYESVEGRDMKGTSYMGHWSWIYFFNNQVSGVQDTEAVRDSEGTTGFKPANNNNGGSEKVNVGKTNYDNVFQWLNDQRN